MVIGNIIVIFKRTSFEKYRERTKRIVKAHEQHKRCIDTIVQNLEQLRIAYRMVDRMNIREIRDYDLVVTIGGDGTLLRASHLIKGIPILGVNSSPPTSVGRLCGATEKSFVRVMKEIQKDRAKTVQLDRISLSIDEKEVRHLALNDVLICDRNPARIVRYQFRFRGWSEEHRCSGMWISTPAGSTAAIHSAGGRPMPLNSRRLQFLVREPYKKKGENYRFLKGFVKAGEVIRIDSMMREGRLYIDGPDVSYTLGYGSVLKIKTSDEPIFVFGVR